MCAHPEAPGNGFEMFLLFVDALALAPPPGLMDKRPVRGIHEADDSVVNAYRHVGGEVCRLKFAAEFFYFGCGRWRIGRLSKACSRRPRLVHEDPYIRVALFTGIAAGV